MKSWKWYMQNRNYNGTNVSRQRPILFSNRWMLPFTTCSLSHMSIIICGPCLERWTSFSGMKIHGCVWNTGWTCWPLFEQRWICIWKGGLQSSSEDKERKGRRSISTAVSSHQCTLRHLISLLHLLWPVQVSPPPIFLPHTHISLRCSFCLMWCE